MTDDARITDPDAITRVLEQRAAELARPHDDPEDDGETVALVVVAVDGERYGIDVERVREITPLAGVTPIPATPPFWLGLVHRRGHLAPVLDLARYLGRRPEGGAPHADAQIVLIAGPGAVVGLMVDAVREVRQVRPSDIGPSLVAASTDRPHVHAGLTADLLAVLDVDALLGDPAIVVQDHVD